MTIAAQASVPTHHRKVAQQLHRGPGADHGMEFQMPRRLPDFLGTAE
jgi:hypothetical protein